METVGVYESVGGTLWGCQKNAGNGKCKRNMVESVRSVLMNTF